MKHKVTSTYYWLRNAIPYLIFLLIIITSCGFPTVPPSQAQQGKSSCPSPSTSTLAPELVLVYVDTLPIYPESYFRAVLQAVASRVYAHVAVGSSPLTVVVKYISSNSLTRPSPLSFTIPGLPALPAGPVLQTARDPYKAAQYRKDYQASLSCWQRQVSILQQKVAQVQASVKGETEKLASLPDITDPVSDDIEGALYIASVHLAAFSGQRTLIIASPLLDNTTENAVSSYAFSGFRGASVTVSDFTCSPASVCAQTQQKYTQLFQKWGASVAWYYPGTPESSELTF